ncbi:Peptidase S10 serine carboxypeptidase, partial [Penicillium atrosanguineum]
RPTMNLAGIIYFFQVVLSLSNRVFNRSIGSSRTSHFEVRSLPDSPALPTSWAGRLPVLGAKTGNDIFFWLFEAEDSAYDHELISDLVQRRTRLFILDRSDRGNGPISFAGNSTHLIRNPYSWTRLGHVLYVDQPVGTGFSTSTYPYPVRDNDGVTADFAQWLHTFFDHFPHLKSKKVHLMGESWAGIYIPYFASALLEGKHSLPLNIQSMSLGDGSWGNAAALSSVAIGTYMHSQSTRLKIPKGILSAFSTADKTCGFDTVLKEASIYPPKGKIYIPGNPEYFNYRLKQRDMTDALDAACDTDPITPAELTNSILNSSCYGPCATFSTAMDYMDTASLKDTGAGIPCFDIYDISHNCSNVDTLQLIMKYFSRSDVQAALHVKNSGTYTACNSTILGILLAAPTAVPPAYHLLPNLVTKHNISLHIYNGELDMLINHIGNELSIQNMTWRGAQGFSKKPNNLFYADDPAPDFGKAEDGDSVGTWNAERGVSYHLFRGAGHSVFATKEREMFAYVRDVVVGGKVG